MDRCAECLSGTYKDSKGADPCQDCSVNEFLLNAARVCTDSHANSASPATSDAREDCKCNARYEPADLVDLATRSAAVSSRVKEDRASRNPTLRPPVKMNGRDYTFF